MGATPGGATSSQSSSRALRVFAVILWIMNLLGLVLFVPLFFFARSQSSRFEDLTGRMATAQARVSAANTPGPTAQALFDELLELEAAVSALQAAQAEIVPGSYDYPAVMAAIAGYPRDSVRLTSITQSQGALAVEGEADSEADLAVYAQSLDTAGLFQQVSIRNVEPLPPTIAAPPTSVTQPPGSTSQSSPAATSPIGEGTRAPTYAVSTPERPGYTAPPTTDAGSDAYEPDDSSPQAITVGTAQSRTFYPLYDVDKTTFVAQSGRSYVIRTFGLSPGVDTFLVATIGGNTYTNDNGPLGDLSSELTISVPAGSGFPVGIVVTNRGEFGPDKGYQLIVEEGALYTTPAIPTPPLVTPTSPMTVAPTSGPAPTATGFEAPTSLPSPTATISGFVPITPTATPTIPMPDAYEPDDRTPRTISVGDTQGHTFYPYNDVDRLSFLAKANRRYRIRTANLAPGVDTQVFVDVGAERYVGDDIHQPFFGTTLVFLAPAHDVVARVEVRNRGVYGAGQSYDITVEEVISIPTSQTLVQLFEDATDVNMVTVPMKAGHSYRVFTSDFGPCVDTVLAVNVAGASYRNNDRAPDTLESEVYVTLRTEQHTDAQIEVWNRRWFTDPLCVFLYHLTVEEVTQPTDDYEPDDVVARPFPVGETQVHTFCPFGDVDKISFIAKTGRRYRVLTSALAAGVDTVLETEVAGTSYLSDDRQPGDRSSELVFDVHSFLPDQHVNVSVSNRGEYGVDKQYSLTVLEEAAPTPTPTPATVDAFEPDYPIPKPIAVGEVQAHTFWPQGDIDGVTFLAKAGRRYRLYTRLLDPGVDTLITLEVDGNTYQNDDRVQGDPASDVSFELPVGGGDHIATARIENRGPYALNATYGYELALEEMVLTPVPTSTPSSLGDAFEPDDVTPSEIGIGEAQLRTFYPEGDIDRVTFLAKEGRWYRVFTEILPDAIGIDTTMMVRAGPALYFNDDWPLTPTPGPGQGQASHIQFQVPPGGDVQVVAEVHNKQGIYRADKYYHIVVWEVLSPMAPWRYERGPGLASWHAPEGLLREAHVSPPQARGPSTSGAVRFTLQLEPILREVSP